MVGPTKALYHSCDVLHIMRRHPMEGTTVETVNYRIRTIFNCYHWWPIINSLSSESTHKESYRWLHGAFLSYCMGPARSSEFKHHLLTAPISRYTHISINPKFWPILIFHLQVHNKCIVSTPSIYGKRLICDGR